MLLWILIVLPICAHCGGLPLLNNLPGGRAGALGGAFTAVADDAEAVFYNPAGLALVRDSEAGVMYTSLDDDFTGGSRFISGDIFFPTKGYGLGAGVVYQEIAGEGVPNPSHSYCLTASSGTRIGSRVALGAGTKFLKSVEGSAAASVVGFDFGILAVFGRIFAGFSMENWNGSLDYDGLSGELPGIMHFGLAYKELGSNAPLTFEYRKTEGEEGTAHAGVEIPAVRSKVYLRAGYASGAGSGDESFLVGVGIRLFEQGELAVQHPLGFELNLYDNLSARGLRDIRLELRRRRL